MITDGRILRMMVRRGFIEWRPQIERHWTGMPVKRCWVAPGPKLAHWSDEFELTIAGTTRTYRLRYIDGCFHPFVCEVGTSVPAFV